MKKNYLNSISFPTFIYNQAIFRKSFIRLSEVSTWSLTDQDYNQDFDLITLKNVSSYKQDKDNDNTHVYQIGVSTHIYSIYKLKINLMLLFIIVTSK